MTYRRRLAGELQSHSKRWAGKNLGRVDDETFEVIEADIYADSATAARTPTNLPKGRLHMRSSRTEAGHTVNEFFGSDAHYVDAFSRGVRKVARIKAI